MVTSGFTSFPVVLVAWQRDRDILVQQLDFVYSHVTKIRKVGVVAQNRPASISGVTFAIIQFSNIAISLFLLLLLLLRVRVGA